MRAHKLSSFLIAVAVAGSLVPPAPAVERPTESPAQLVAAYHALADTILGAKQTEWNLVHAILASTYGHAEGVYAAARAKLKSGAPARDEVEQLAALVSQLGNEGDASVAAVRKRLIEGGHHHNAKGEAQGKYDEGFVIVTRVAKKALLDAATRIGKLAASSDPAGLETEWNAVVTEFRKLHESVASMK
jgi:hypothetical protein